MASYMQRGWKKDEFSSPDLIWDLDLDGTIVEERKDKKTGEIKYVEVNVSGSSVKLVYLYLVRWLDIDKTVFPSMATIAKHTQISEKTVIRCLRYLEQIGLIEIHHRYKINEKGKKVHDSNLYIVNHPKQVPGLKYLEGTVMNTQPFCNDYTTPGVMITPPLCNDYTTPGVMITQNNISSSSNKNSSSSVENTPEYQVLNKAWKECFDEDLLAWEFLALSQLAEIGTILEIIYQIKEHHDLSTIQSFFAFVQSCIKKGGYKPPKNKKAKKAAASGQPKRESKPKIPKAVQKQLEEEAAAAKKQLEEGYNQAAATGTTMSPEEYAERLARLEKKKAMLDEVLSQRQKQMGP